MAIRPASSLTLAVNFAEPYNEDAADNVDLIEWLLKAAAEENISENVPENDDQEAPDEPVAEDITIASYSPDEFVDSDTAIDIAQKCSNFEMN
ncbi:hypothetical protein ACJ73_10342 [Blastomyces percursus]|uniref:Uncharacterized protein n=1 Tax=Blastomyces percursus TaxID=1658174 RepID=A0A1J9NXQ1_9EURO|nr:hypothetical protein ACJ73_10342 [Blastomyces percursus]